MSNLRPDFCCRFRRNFLLLSCSMGLLAPCLGFAQTQPSPLPGRIATLAFFLDSVDTIEPQSIWLTNILTYRKSPGGKELDVPTLGISYGLHRRVQVNYSIPYFRSRYGTDFRMNGIGDKFLSAKIKAVEPESHPVGVAFEPVLEILGKGSLAAGELGPKKYNFALPVILQKNFGRFNLYGETGYITRGAAFAGIGADGALANRLGLAVNLLYSRSTKFNELSRQFGLLQSRTDANVGLYYVFTPRVSFFTSTGRTVSAMDPNATSYILNFGLNVNFSLRDLVTR